MPLLSRRSFTTALGGSIGLAAVLGLSTGCSLSSDSDDDRPSADEALITTIVAALDQATLEASSQRKPALVALHQAHAALLRGPDPVATEGTPSLAPTPTASASTTAPATTTAGAAVSADEATLVSQLSDAANSAESGTLARTFASMAAATRQLTGHRWRAPVATHAGLNSLPDDPYNEVLAAEHAAVWLYGVVSARALDAENSSLAERFQRYYDAHLSERDSVLAIVAQRKGSAVAAAASYPLPARFEQPTQWIPTTLAAEESLSQALTWLIAQLPAGERGWPIATLQDTAARELALRGTPEIFPGASELTDRTAITPAVR